MAELSFQDSKAVRSGGAMREARNESLDSVIYTPKPNFSHFSSASVDRSSFASDAQDRDSLSFDFSQHMLHSADGHLSKKADKPEVHKHEDDKVPLDIDDEASPLVSARNSFSLALKECQERRLRSEALTKQSELQRQDLNKPAVLMRKNITAPRKSVNFPSPGTPIYRQASEGVNKGWQSERVPLQTSTNRRQQLSTTSLTFNNGRNLPSKWEDAERWIFSPVADDGIGKPSRLQQKKKQKSKSGPLGAPGYAYYAQYSPGISMYDDSNINSLIAAAGVLMPAAVSPRPCRGNGYLQKKGEPCVARSASVNGCSNLICQSSGASSQDEKVEDAKEEKVSRRDAATQMSPESNSPSSRRSSSFSASTPSILPIREVLNINSTKQNVRDVQVDERVTFTRWSKKHKSRVSGKSSEDERDWKLESHSSTWQDTDASKTSSKTQRDEAKITAWENLQKAKAEAAIRKLEMKLEKKRSKTIDKIMAKVRSAEKKAEEMRSSVTANQETQVSKTSFKAMPSGRTWQIISLSGCFTCKAF